MNRTSNRTNEVVRAASFPKSGTWRVYDATDGLTGGVRCLLQDRDGFLWIGTRGAGLYRFDGEEFEQFTSRHGLPSDCVEALRDGIDGTLWVGTARGLGRFRQGRFEILPLESGDSDLSILGICLHPDGTLCCLTESGIYTVSPLGGLLVEHPGSSLLAGPFSALDCDREGNLWIASKSGLHRISTETVTTWTEEDGLPPPPYLSVLCDSQEKVWIGCEDRLVCFAGQLCEVYSHEQGLGEGKIVHIWEDRLGLIWISHWGGGVTCFEGKSFQVYSAQQGLAGNHVTSFLHDREGLYFFGEDLGALSQLDPQSFHLLCDTGVDRCLSEDLQGGIWFTGEKSLHLYTPEYFLSQHFQNTVSDLVLDSHGRVWVGTTEGLYLFSTTEAVWLGEGKRVLDPEGNETWPVACLLEAQDGTIWAAPGQGNRVYRYSTGGPVALPTPLPRVRALFEDSSGRLWIGDSPGTGVAYLSEGKWFQLELPASDHQGLAIRFLEDDQGAIWVHSEYTLWRYSTKGHFRRIKRNDLSGLVQSVSVTGPDGRVWLGTQGGGLFVTEGTCSQQFSVEDGLPSNTITGLLVREDGTLFVGTARGLSRYRPEFSVPPNIVLRETLTDRVHRNCNTIEMVFRHSQVVTFSYSGLGLATATMRYRYRLEGFDPDWTYTKERTVRYENIAPGEYRFEVYAINRDLAMSETPAWITLRVVPDPTEKEIHSYESRLEQIEKLLEGEQRLALLNKVLVDLGTSTSLWEGDLEGALRQIAEISARAIEVSRVGIWLLDEEEDCLRCWEYYDAQEETHTHGISLSLADHKNYIDALSENRLIDAKDAFNDPRTREFAEDYLKPGEIASVLDAPIRIGGKTVGVVCHEVVGATREWVLEDKYFVASIVDFVALAIERWERRKAEESLQKTHDIYRRAIQNSQGLPYVRDLATNRYSFVGEGAQNLLGIPAEELTPSEFNRHLIQTIPSNPEKKDASPDYEQEFRTGKIDRYQADIHFRRPDGREIWLTDTALPIKDPITGEIISELGILQDITDRKLAAERIENTQQDYHRAISVAGAVPYRQSYLTGKYEFLSPEIEKLTGYTAQEFTYQVWESITLETELLGHLIGLPVEEAVARARGEEGVSWRADYHIRTRSGEEKWVSNAAIQLRDEEGRVVGSLGILQDITDRKLAIQKIEESEELYRSAIEVAGAVPYYQVYDAAQYRFIGEGIKEMVGCEPDEFDAYWENNIEEVVLLGDLQGMNYLDAVEKCRKEGTVWRADYRFRRPDGQLRWVSNSAVQVRDESGKVVASLGILLDITDRMRAQEEARAMEAQIQHAQKLESLGVLAGGVAHDFNNLLMGILGNASLAKMEVSDSSQVYDFLEQIEIASHRAADLTNQMLAYSGRGRFIIKPINLNSLVKEMATLLETTISKKIDLHYRFSQDLPTIEGDSTQIRQVVMNLITNASDAIGNEKGSITLSTGMIDAERSYLSHSYVPDDLDEGPYVFVEVRDTGCGMNKETQERIFEPFFTTKFTGRGLGLAALLGIVRGHKGAVRVYSEPGKGTAIKVLFPHAGHHSDRLPSPEGTQSHWKGCGVVLLVDDEEYVRTVGTKMLRQAGFRSLLASDGVEALEIFKQRHEEISLVLLDMTMPNMDGIEAFQQLRALDQTVPVILSSGYNEVEAIQRFEGRGLAGFLQKPYTPFMLRDKIRQVLDPTAE